MGSQSGFSLIEMTIVTAVVVPILGGVAMTTISVNSSMEANNRAADVNTHARRVMTRVAKLVRPIQASSIKMPAVAADVTLGLATSVGEWFAPTDLVARPGIEFTSSSGLLSMNAALSTSTRRAEFVMDSNETDNDVDDDGDGLVDEGRIELVQNSITLAILRDVEQLAFTLDGRMLTIRIGVARRASNGVVYRFTLDSEFYIRNN